ncbi:hypothetical protein [Actinoplanes sp. NPDC026623]|uniref:hypothetical protein n=1 Tax=Actinoplanes sp. NPDC026623 TaxID=3155610 RepID=UPI0033FDFFC8
MTSTPARVYAQGHLFVLADADADPAIETLDFSTGVAGTSTSAAFICTGIDSGHVHVSTEALTERPALDTATQWAQMAAWDDVAEFSLHAPRGLLTIERLTTTPAATRPDLAPLSSAGPGTYRIRVHARGRDHQHDQTVDDSNERFHISAWPESITAPIIITTTSQCGYGLRLSTLHNPPTAPAPTPSTPQQHADAEHQAMLRRALQGK